MNEKPSNNFRKSLNQIVLSPLPEIVKAYDKIKRIELFA
jgi:hypothetical protein